MKKVKVLLTFIICFVLCSCGSEEVKDIVNKENSNEPNSEANFIVNEEFSELPDEQIETVYGPLFFSGQWKDKMTAEVINNDIETEVVFYSQSDIGKEKLFAIFLGGGSGFPIGILETKEGYDLDVTAEFYDISTEGRTQEDLDELYAMQEQINYVVLKLKNNDNFQSTNN